MEAKQQKAMTNAEIAFLRSQDGWDARLNQIDELYREARRRGDVNAATELWATWKYLRQGEREFQAEQQVQGLTSAPA
jgi:hypothetical protein